MEEKSQGINQGETVQEGSEEIDCKPQTQQNVDNNAVDLTSEADSSHKNQSSPKTKSKKRFEADDFHTDDQLLSVVRKR